MLRRRPRVRRTSDKTFDFNLSPGSPPASFHVPWGFLVDSLTAVMLLVVSVIGMLVHYYSIGYMHGDGGYYRFFAYLNLFMFTMFMLILANNYLLLFLGWEGVGLCSYLLICFWFHKKSASAGRQEGLHRQPRGRLRLHAGRCSLIFVTFGTLQFTGVFAAACRATSPRHRHLDLPAAVHRRHGQERPVPAARLAARRHGGPDAGQRPDPRRHHGQRRRLHGRPQLPARSATRTRPCWWS